MTRHPDTPASEHEALTPQDPHFRRLLWRSRRGLLELDLFLEPFIRDVLATLPRHEQDAYADLLECTDPELHEWLAARAEPPETLAPIVRRIREHVRGAPPADRS